MTSPNRFSKDLQEARSLIARSDFIKASEFLQTIMFNSRQEKLYNIECDTLCELGRIYWIQGKYENAYEVLSAAHSLAKNNNYKFGEAYALNYLGHVLRYLERQNNSQKPIELYERSLSIRREIKDFSGIAASLNNIAICYAEEGDFKTALSHYQQSITVEEQIGNIQGIAQSLNNIGELHRQRGEISAALKAYEQARNLFTDLHNRDGIALATQNIGLLNWGLGRVKKAENLLLESLDTWYSLKIQNKTVVENLSALAGIYADQKQFEKANEYLKHSESLNSKINVPRARLHWLFAKGYVAWVIGNTATAFEFFKRCHDEAKQTNFFDYSVFSLIHLAEMNLVRYRLNMEEKDLQKARKNLEETVIIAEQKKMLGLLTETNIIRGMLESTLMNYKESIEIFSHTVSVAKDLNLVKQQKTAEDHLEKILQQQQKVRKFTTSVTPGEELKEVLTYLNKYSQLLKGLKT